MGYSEAPAGADMSPRAHAESLRAFLDALSIDTVDVIASDNGGAIAQIFVAQNPARVRTLLLTNCDAHDDCPPKTIRKYIPLARAGKQTEEIVVPWHRDHAFCRSPGQLGDAYTYPESTLTDELLDCYLAPLVKSPLRKQQADQFLAGFDPNPLLAIEPVLGRFPGAVKIVWGTGDNVMDPSSPDWLDHLFPRSRGVRRVPGAKLFFPEEFPDLIAEEARKLWGVAA